jgi:TolB-like protein/tetratricopeptide (TPR) repeat protein
MPSQVPGFEYDLFISYRQNDNKVVGQGEEGWVTHFVNNLSAELEATVKGRVSIYFDRNPHDGLLETHIVDESLSDKLKVLVFVPIVSQTYCDPESFAWRQEFMAFNRLAAADRFGLSVKLPNGNVGSRVLPIRIHELDADDVRMIEGELKTKLRPVDFVFKAPGVNRPLRHNEDDPLKNVNRITYRDQVNKAANAIKELIAGMKNLESPATHPTRPAAAKPDSLSLGESVSHRSVAVLPLVTGNTEDAYLGESVAEEIVNALLLVRGIKVAPRAASFQFRDAAVKIQSVGERLNVSTVVTGRVTRVGPKYAVELVASNARDGSRVSGIKKELTADELAGFLRSSAVDIAAKAGAQLKETDRELIARAPTPSGEAYLHFLMGRYFLRRQGEDLRKALSALNDAVAAEKAFAGALASLAECYVLLGYGDMMPFPEAMRLCRESAMRALQVNPSLQEAYLPLAFVAMCYEWNWPEGEIYFNKVLALNPLSPSSVAKFVRCRDQIAAHLEESGSEPLTGKPLFLQAFALLHRGRFEEALKAGLQARETDPDSYMANRAVGLSYMGLERYDQAAEALLTASRLSNRHQDLLFELMGAYSFSGRHEEAHAIVDEALANANALPSRVYNHFFGGA